MSRLFGRSMAPTGQFLMRNAHQRGTVYVGLQETRSGLACFQLSGCNLSGAGLKGADQKLNEEQTGVGVASVP